MGSSLFNAQDHRSAVLHIEAQLKKAATIAKDSRSARDALDAVLPLRKHKRRDLVERDRGVVMDALKAVADARSLIRRDSPRALATSLREHARIAIEIEQRFDRAYRFKRLGYRGEQLAELLGYEICRQPLEKSIARAGCAITSIKDLGDGKGFVPEGTVEAKDLSKPYFVALLEDGFNASDIEDFEIARSILSFHFRHEAIEHEEDRCLLRDAIGARVTRAALLPRSEFEGELRSCGVGGIGALVKRFRGMPVHQLLQRIDDIRELCALERAETLNKRARTHRTPTSKRQLRASAVSRTAPRVIATPQRND